jgi:hypothetical protein
MAQRTTRALPREGAWDSQEPLPRGKWTTPAGADADAKYSFASRITFSRKRVALSALAGGISSGLATNPLFKGADLDKVLLRSTVGNVLTQGVGVVTGLQSSFSWRGVAASAAGAVAGHVAGNLLGDAVGTASWDPWAKEMVTRTGAGLAAGTVASIAQGGRVNMQQVATDAFGNALGWSVAGAALPAQPNVFVSELQNSDRYAAQLRGLPGVQLAQAEIHLGDVWNAGGVHMQAPVFDWSRMVTVSAMSTDWANPFTDLTLSAAQWTVSSIANFSWSQPYVPSQPSSPAVILPNGVTSMAEQTSLLARQAQARLTAGQQMTAWDGVTRQSPAETYLTQARGGLDAVCDDQWGMRAARSLPDAVINEVGGLAAAKAIGMLSKAAAPVRGAIFGERSVLMSNLQTEMRAGLRADLPIGPSLEGITPGGSAAVFGNVGRVGDLPIGETPPLLALSRQPGLVTRNALSDAEFAQAQDLALFRGGKFVGAPTDSFPGIDGWLDSVPTQLKIVTGKGEQAVLRNIVKGARNMSAQGYVGDIAVDATQSGVSVDGFAKFVTPHTPVGRILNEGSVNNVYVKFGDGWLNITQGTLVVPGR